MTAATILYTYDGEQVEGLYDVEERWCVCDASAPCFGCRDPNCDHESGCEGEHEAECMCARQDLVRTHGERGAREYAYSHGGPQYRALIEAIDRAGVWDSDD